MVLLRTSIGWHFFTEGLWKLNNPSGKEFTAEPYLRISHGPLASYFRNIVPDVDGKDRLRRDAGGRPIGLKQRWANELDALAAHYHFTSEQRAKADKALEAMSARADEWFLAPDNADKVLKYLDYLAKIEAVEQNPNALQSQVEAARKRRKEIDTDRRELLALVDGWTGELRTTWTAPDLITEQQKTTYGKPSPQLTQLDLVNNTTKWGLTLVGACLMLGLFTRLAGLGGAAFLALFYFSLPPWPGFPEPPNAEGHYLYVNKNLIEMFACLFIAATPSGRWIGLDALFARPVREEPAALPAFDNTAEDADGPGSNPATFKPDRPRGSVEPRQPIPLG